MKKKFTQSNLLLKRIEKNIPLASQTFSKSKLFLPDKRAPLFLKKGLKWYKRPGIISEQRNNA